MDTCTFLGIYPEYIESASEMCEAAMEKLGFSLDEIDDMYDFAKQEFEEIGSLNDITNSVISCLFRNAEISIHEKFPSLRVTYYVEGCCSSFEVNDLPDPLPEDDIRADWHTALNTMTHHDIAKEIGWGFYPNDLRELLRLYRACFQRLKIEDLLTECNFHSFCCCLSEDDYDGAEAEIKKMEEESE